MNGFLPEVLIALCLECSAVRMEWSTVLNVVSRIRTTLKSAPNVGHNFIRLGSTAEKLQGNVLNQKKNVSEFLEAAQL